jgi:hypothetical protein
MTNNHGIKIEKSNLEKCIGKWVILNITGNGTIYGKIKDVNRRDVTFNPHFGIRYNIQENCNLHVCINEDAYLELSPNGYYLEPTNKKTLDCHAKKQNAEIIKNSMKKEIFDSLKK